MTTIQKVFIAGVPGVEGVWRVHFLGELHDIAVYRYAWGWRCEKDGAWANNGESWGRAGRWAAECPHIQAVKEETPWQ